MRRGRGAASLAALEGARAALQSRLVRRGPPDTVIPWKVPGPFDVKQKPPAAGQAGHTVITEHLLQHKQARVSFGRGTGWRGRKKPEGASFGRKGLVAGEGGGLIDAFKP